MNRVLQFETDIDAAFCIAYTEIGASSNLLKRRLLYFKREFGETLDGLLNTANRMSLASNCSSDFDPRALDRARDFCHTLATGWIFKRQNLFNKIENELL